MARKSKITVYLRRKREGKTDYKKRLRLLMSERPRVTVRKSLRHMQVQLIGYEPKGDRIIISAQTGELKKFGWTFSCSNIPAAYLVGYLAGKKMIAKGIKNTILDKGLQADSRRIYAVLKGLVDSGVEVPYDEKVIPKDDLLKGEHISKYAEMLSKDKAMFEKQFSGYIKKRTEIKDITSVISKVKENIDKK